MKLFDAVPSELFSPLASPNRVLYADAPEVLHTAYQENLKIREDTLYSMLRSKLEQQLIKWIREDMKNGKYPLFHDAIEQILEYGVTIEQEVFLN